jgi:hypothetical protein
MPSFEVKNNSQQESTGGSGSMSNTEYDIYCPQMGGPDWRMNYLATSCLERRAHGCRKPGCQYNGNRPAKSKEPEKKYVHVRSVRECACCHEEKKINGRELCGRCYGLNRYHGTLENYPKAEELKGSK